jgi:hypothetical protein
MKKFTFLFVSFIVLFSTVVILTFTISTYLSDYHARKIEMAETLNFEDRLLNVWEWIPYNTVGEKKVAYWQKLESEASVLYDRACVMGALLAGIVVLFMVINLLYYIRKEHKLQAYGLTMVFAALSFLYLGLQSPFLEIEGYNKDLAFKVPIDIDLDAMPVTDLIKLGMGQPEAKFGHFEYDLDQTFEGRVYYFYQNKSILELIKLLYTGGNFVVALCLLMFSILFPVTKLLTSMFVFMNPQTGFARRAVPIINSFGKWSMADVFVAAIFLAYFSFANMNVGVDTGSTTLIGTYFFLSFVVLSILSGSVFKRLTGKS